MTRWSASLCLLLTAVACRAPTPEPATADRFPAPDGAQVRVEPLPVQRIVSTMQSATEWLVLLGAADALVARTDYDRQPELAHLPSIGGGLDPSAEVIASLTPDVVLGWRIRASADLQRTLAPFNIPVIAVEATDTGEVFTQLGVLGRLVAREHQADSLAAALRDELTDARASCVGNAESVVIILSTEPPVTSGGGTWMDQLLAAACLTNLFGDLTIPWPTISVEALVARQPDWVLTSTGSTPSERLEALRAAPGWRDLDAVRNGRVLEIHRDLFSRAGPTMGEWVRAIREARGVRRVNGER